MGQEFPLGTSKYSPEFRADAVALYHASPGGTYASVAKDLGINHGRGRGLVGKGFDVVRFEDGLGVHVVEQRHLLSSKLKQRSTS
ncbi:transposase [Kitasatospora purpeofusca]|uniref:transposase n=1 Tax=Kitasatospora purpeofusca TaxID=67352 RepID=UPI00367721A4